MPSLKRVCSSPGRLLDNHIDDGPVTKKLDAATVAQEQQRAVRLIDHSANGPAHVDPFAAIRLGLVAAEAAHVDIDPIETTLQGMPKRALGKLAHNVPDDFRFHKLLEEAHVKEQHDRSDQRPPEERTADTMVQSTLVKRKHQALFVPDQPN